MKPWPEQIKGADEAEAILREYGLVYIAYEERTGKTLMSIVLTERLERVNSILVVTKKKAIAGWEDTLKAFAHNKVYYVVNYHAAHKAKIDYDLVILDEAHAYISGYPKRGKIWKDLWKLCVNKPIIYMSATPCAQGRQLLFNQFALSSWSPFKKFKDYYAFFKKYVKLNAQGEVPMKYIGAMQKVFDYTAVDQEAIWNDCKHLFVTKTRAELGFEHEPEDELHWIELSQTTKDVYNTIVTHKVLVFEHGETGKEYTLVCDTPAKYRFALHMLEGGTLKVGDDYLDLGNTEKVDYILKTWGDSENLVIMYYYQADAIKLGRKFKKARLLQATTYAEGIDLSMYEHLVIYSQDFSTARHTQRRARQANRNRETPIKVHYLLVKNGASHKCYKTVSLNKKNFVDTTFERI